MPDFWTVSSLIIWVNAQQGVGLENTTSVEGTFAVEDFEGGRWALRGVRTGGEGGQKSSGHVKPTKGL